MTYYEFIRAVWHKGSEKPSDNRTVYIFFRIREISFKCVGNYDSNEKCWRCGRGIKVEDFYCDEFYWCDITPPGSE